MLTKRKFRRNLGNFFTNILNWLSFRLNLRDKTMNVKSIYTPIHEKLNYPCCRLKLLKVFKPTKNRDKTMADKLMYIPNDDTQKTFCRLQ